MPEISRFYGIVVRLFYGDHGPPHFHAEYAGEHSTAGGGTHAAFGRRSIPAEPRRFAPLIVAFRSKYTRYSSLTRLVSRAPHRPRRSPGFHHRLLKIGIKDLAVLRGRLAPRALGLVMEWAAMHQSELLTAWERAERQEAPGRISPLG